MSLIVNQGAILSPLKILVNSPPLFLFLTAPVVNTLLLNGKESDRYMDGSTKILTVSYGTFSCTLEGFDDPLGAMRDIAEYFRDLAADDRYFGAEPLTPDAEMLQNIAEREVGRRVEARMDDGGVALRQVEDRNAEVDPQTEPDIHEAAPNTVDAVADETARNDREEDGVLAARVLTAAKTADTLAAAKKNETPDTGTGPLTFDDEFLMSDEPEDVLAIDPGADVVDAGPAETVAEKLRRIRSVVSKNIEDRAGADDVDHVEMIAPEKRDRAFTDTIDQITADIADDEMTKPEAKVDTNTDEKPVQTEADTNAGPDQSDAEVAGADFTDFGVDDDSARLESAARDKSEAPWAQDADAEVAAFDKDLLRNDVGDEVVDLASEGAEDKDFDPDTSESLFLTDGDGVDRNLDADITEAVLERTSREVEPEESADKAAASDDPKSDAGEQTSEPTTIEHDASTKRTVSEIISNLSDRIAGDDDGEAQDEDVPASTEPVRAISRPLSEAQESDVGRLIEKTDNKLNEDEVVRRRRVISQMRAAVAATKADRLVTRQVSKEVVEEEERSPYREDLSEVVRSASIDGAGIERSPSTPPLVLVSSQRVDEENAEESQSSDPGDEPQNFAGFAQDMGAKELPELLEAAAAFTVFKEGQSSFTRPEIMKRVAAVDPTIRMSREESLRSFGQLLRQGKFRKLERGQFTIDKETRYNPEHRIA